MEDLGARGRLRAREMKTVSEIKSKQPVRWRARGGNEDRGNYINDSMSKVERAREIKTERQRTHTASSEDKNILITSVRWLESEAGEMVKSLREIY